MEDVDRLGDVLQMHPPAVDVLEPAETACQPRGRLADDHLSAVGPAAQTGGNVQRGAAVAAVLEPDCLARVDPDPDLERKLGVRLGLLAEPRLQIDRGADRLAGGREHRESLVAPDLDQRAAVGLDTFADQVDELAGEPALRLRRRTPRCSASSRAHRRSGT